MTTSLRFDLTGYGCSVESFTIRRLTGADWYAAVDRASGPTGIQPTDRAIRHESFADAVEAVDGEKVVQPYAGWRDWTVRTVEFMSAAFAAVNELSARDALVLRAQDGPVYNLEALGLDMTTVRLEALTARAELAALEGAKAGLGRAGQQAAVLGLAVTEIDGIPRHPSVDEVLAWSARTNEALRYLYFKRNSVDAAVLEDFVKAVLTPEEERPPGESPSSSSGPGSPATSPAPLTSTPSST